MKLTKIFGIVLSLHVVVILLVMFQPGCQTAEKKQPQVDDVSKGAEQDKKSPPSFNQGIETPEPSDNAAKTPGNSLVDPTRPAPGELIVPGQNVPGVLIGADEPGPINVTPTDVIPYNVQRGDTLWGIAKKNKLSLSDLLSGNPNLDKNAGLSIGQEILIPSTVGSIAPSESLLPVPVVDASPSVPATGSSYVVQSGDSLSKIARNQGVGLNELMQANGLTKQSIIRVGQGLIIPEGATGPIPLPTPVREVAEGALTHVVKRGDNLTRIAAIYGSSVKQIMDWNGLSDAGRISIGQKLIISEPSSAAQPINPPSSDGNSPEASVQDFFKVNGEERPIIDVTEPTP
jgi:LysM repeat protein